MAHLQVIHVCYLLLFDLISQDITKLWTGRVTCHKHHTQCQVRTIEGTVIGISCKDLARSNPKRWLLHGNVLASKTSPGKTADTFWGFIKLLDSPVGGSPTWCILENSPRFGHPEPLPILDEVPCHYAHHRGVNCRGLAVGKVSMISGKSPKFRGCCAPCIKWMTGKGGCEADECGVADLLGDEHFKMTEPWDVLILQQRIAFMRPAAD